MRIPQLLLRSSLRYFECRQVVLQAHEPRQHGPPCTGSRSIRSVRDVRQGDTSLPSTTRNTRPCSSKPDSVFLGVHLFGYSVHKRVLLCAAVLAQFLPLSKFLVYTWDQDGTVVCYLIVKRYRSLDLIASSPVYRKLWNVEINMLEIGRAPSPCILCVIWVRDQPPVLIRP